VVSLKKLGIFANEKEASLQFNRSYRQNCEDPARAFYLWLGEIRHIEFTRQLTPNLGKCPHLDAYVRYRKFIYQPKK